MWLQFLRLGRVGYTKIMQVTLPVPPETWACSICWGVLRWRGLCWPMPERGLRVCAAQNCHTVAMFLCEGIEKTGFFNIVSARNPVPGLPLCTFSLKVTAAADLGNHHPRPGSCSVHVWGWDQWWCLRCMWCLMHMEYCKGMRVPNGSAICANFACRTFKQECGGLVPRHRGLPSAVFALPRPEQNKFYSSCGIEVLCARCAAGVPHERL